MASKYASREFWTDALDRAAASIAQGAIAAAALGPAVGLLDVDWVGVGSIAGGMGVLSLLTSIAFRGNGKPGDPEAAREAARNPYWDPV